MHTGVEELYRAHYAEVRRFASRHVGPALADDVAAATFELALRKLQASHPHPVGWLFRTARNLCKAELRRQGNETRAVRDSEVVTAGAPQDELDDIEIVRLLLTRLPEREREVLRLTYWDRLPAADAAVVMGCSERAVWKRVSRAKAALRAEWGRCDEVRTRDGLEGVWLSTKSPTAS